MAIFHTEPQRAATTRQSLTGTRWLITPPETATAAGVHPAIGQVLAARGVVTPAEVETFLHAGLAQLPDPGLLPDMAPAVALVQDTLARGARIRIFGDYDADGITATALLVRALSALGAKPDTIDWYLPHRIDDGYGLNIQALDEARAAGVVLGITVDNGITAHAQLAHARAIGLRMIVTDHHEPDGTLPPADAVLNPKRADSTYPFRELAGVGVAYALLCALCAARGLPASAPAKFLDLVTIGTVADIAPLTGANRLLVRHGLPLITPGTKKIGLAALLRVIKVQHQATCTDVGFSIGPRLNAAGRVAHAQSALRLLLTTDAREADELATQLDANNARRQDEEQRTLAQVLEMVQTRDLAREKVLVLASPDWHPGVIGIVASRIVERYHRPCALIAVQEGIGKGSARARAPFHLWEALEECHGLLVRFGGHRVAAGFEVAADNIPALQAALGAIGDRVLSADDLLPALAIDALLDLPEVTTDLARQLQTLEPFGLGNPTPVFAATDAIIQSCSACGQDGAHLRLAVRPPSGTRPVSGIWFRHGELAQRLHPGDRIDIAFNLSLNTWQGVTSAQLMVKDVAG